MERNSWIPPQAELIEIDPHESHASAIGEKDMRAMASATIRITMDTAEFDADGMESVEHALTTIDLPAALEHAATECLHKHDFLGWLISQGMVRVDLA